VKGLKLVEGYPSYKVEEGLPSSNEGKMSAVIGDLGYVFRKEFGAQGWFTGTVVRIMKDGDRRCKYSDGDVEDLLLDDLVQLAKLDPNYHNRTKEKKIPIAEKKQPKKKRRKCNVVGCINQVVKGGVCITHGATVKRCSSKRCTNHAKRGGVCVTHGAKLKRCSFDRCNNHVVKGGVCVTHGATVKCCSFEDCNNHAKRGGVCVTHGAKKKRCSHKGCTNQTVVGGVCITHGATVKCCSFEDCNNHAKKGGVCYRHRTKSINANDNPTLQLNDVTSVMSHHLPMNYEDEEEELNSWIWRSSRRARCVA
jgi:hypothetical protein